MYPNMGDAAGAAAGTALLGPAGTVIGGLIPVGGLIHSSAAGPNRDAAAATWPEVQRNNLAAVAAFVTRAGIHTVTSAQPWIAGVAQIPQALLDAAATKFPGNQWATFGAIPPEAVLPTVQRLAAYVTVDPSSGAVTSLGTKPPTNVPGGTQAGILGGNMTTLLLAGAGLFVVTKLVERRR